MSEEEITEELEKELRKKREKDPDYLVEVKHSGIESSDDLAKQFAAEKRKREEAETVIELMAEKDFEDRKNAFLNLIPEEDKRNELAEKIGDDPDTLKRYEDMTGFLATMLQKSGVRVVDSEGEEVTIAGRAKLPQGSNAQSGEDNYKQYVDGLYDILKDPSKTTREKQIADKQINQLYAEMVLGLKSKGPRNRDMPYLPPVATCPNCGGALIGDTESCPSCGWKLYAKNFTPRGR